MPIIYPARWTRGRILDLGLQKASNTKIRAMARDVLNRLLEDLYVSWEWPFLYTSAAITIATDGTFDLPADFLKTQDEYSLQVPPSVMGRLWPILETDIVTMDRLFDGVLTAQIPRRWAVDASTRRGIAFPMPTDALGCTLTYKFLPPDMPTSATDQAIIAAYDADIPIFPFGSYLALAMDAWALEYDENQLAPVRQQQVARELDRLRNAAIPPRTQPVAVPLDPETFGQRTMVPEDWFHGWPHRW